MQNIKNGRLLTRIFCSLLINSLVGITSMWISTDDNAIADNISSQMKQSANDTHFPITSFDYLSLKQKYLELADCSFFQIEPHHLADMGDNLDRELAKS